MYLMRNKLAVAWVSIIMAVVYFLGRILEIIPPGENRLASYFHLALAYVVAMIIMECAYRIRARSGD